MNISKIMNLFKNKEGFSIVEALVSLVIISLALLSVYGLIVFLVRVNYDNKYRVSATMLAEKKIEHIIGLDYRDIGTLSGIVRGVLPDEEIISNQNGNFKMSTIVMYVDDPYDGLEGGVPNDSVPTDYKIVHVRVEWEGFFDKNRLTNSIHITPDSMETGEGMGTLAVLVFDAYGSPLDDAAVTIKNNKVLPLIDFTALTNEDGVLIFPGADEATESYEINVLKSGYSSSYTTSRTEINPNPVKPHATVIASERTDIGFSIDLLANLKIKTALYGFEDNVLINDRINNLDQINPVIDADESGYMYTAWQRMGIATSAIYMQKLDSNLNKIWMNDLKVGSGLKQENSDLDTAIGGTTYLVWQEESFGGDDDIYTVAIQSGGSELWSEEKVNSDSTTASQENPRIAVTQNFGFATSTIVWQDNRNGDFDIYSQSFDSAGNKVWSFDNVIASDSSDEHSPDIAINNSDEVLVAWVGEEAGSSDIYAHKFDLSGNSIWSNKVIVASTVYNEERPSVATDDFGAFYVTWTEERDEASNIYFLAKHSDTGSLIWQKQVNLEDVDSDQFGASVYVDGSFVYVSWTDSRSGLQDVYVQKFTLSGNSVWSEDLRLNTNRIPSNQDNALVVSGGVGQNFAVWQDNRNGEFNIYAGEFNSPELLNMISGVSLDVSGQKLIGTNPDLPKFSDSLVSDSSGLIELNDLEWDSYNMSLSEGYTDYTIVTTNPLLPFSLLPGQNRELVIYLE